MKWLNHFLQRRRIAQARPFLQNGTHLQGLAEAGPVSLDFWYE
jgi:hypothetical protein